MKTLLLLILASGFLPQASPQTIAAMGRCKPASMRRNNGDQGCWILADRKLGVLGTPVYWYVDRFPTRAAAEAARTSRGTVVEALGKTWLLTIERDAWKGPAGERVSAIGPLPIDAARPYSAQFMEAITNPGWTSEVHRHPGPEAWYTEGGETCLETPNGVMRGSPPSKPVIVPGDTPMHLTATGTQQRRALVLVLHDSSQPAGIMLHDWTPKGLCRQ